MRKNRNTLKILIIGLMTLFATHLIAQISIDDKAKEIEETVIDWYRDFHENPELGNREFRTSEIIAKHLK